MADNSGFGEAAKWIVIGLGGFAAFMLYQQSQLNKQADTITESLCKTFPWLCGGNSEPISLPSLDEHGCRVDIQHWCETDRQCRDVAIACTRPITSDDCYSWQTWNGTSCIGKFEPWIIPPVIDVPPVIQNDYCENSRSVRVNVPPGSDCTQVFADLCARFGSSSQYCDENSSPPEQACGARLWKCPTGWIDKGVLEDGYSHCCDPR